MTGMQQSTPIAERYGQVWDIGQVLSDTQSKWV